jgi:hypothetical protein
MEIINKAYVKNFEVLFQIFIAQFVNPDEIN